MVEGGEGFELFQSRKSDLRLPHLKCHLKMQFYRLPDIKCKKFSATLERVEHVERLCKAMTEAADEARR